MSVAAIRLVPVIVAFFRHKVVRSIIVLACLSPIDQVKFTREISKHGYSATIMCDPTPAAMDRVHPHGLQGVLYFTLSDDSILEKVGRWALDARYVWAVVGASLPLPLGHARHDAHITLFSVQPRTPSNEFTLQALRESTKVKHDDLVGAVGNDLPAVPKGVGSIPAEVSCGVEGVEGAEDAENTDEVWLRDVYGGVLHEWARWWRGVLQGVARGEYARLQRRLNFDGRAIRFVTPKGQYSQQSYGGNFIQYLSDDKLAGRDAGIRCGHVAGNLLLQRLNATEVLIMSELWAGTVNNNSMVLMLQRNEVDLGGIVRLLPERREKYDYIIPIWPFSTGFTLVGARARNSNMFVAPFSREVWAASATVLCALCIALRGAARSRRDADHAFYVVLASWLHQDAGTMPGGAAARVAFVVAAGSGILLHAYYTSAIVSALMRADGTEPSTMRALADSAYHIASEDYDYMRYNLFEADTKWEDFEYMKRKKKTSNMYMELERGVQLVREGSVAFHTEYNQLYPLLNTFGDDDLCRLQHIDTMPEMMTWVTAPRFSEHRDSFRVAGAWVLEVGLGSRVVQRLRANRPPCRQALLAARVTAGDVAPLLEFFVASVLFALLVLTLETLVAMSKKLKNTPLLLPRRADITKK